MPNIITMNSRGALMPRTMQEAMQFADMIAHSDMVPKDYKGKPANVMVAIQWGAELGISPLQSLQNISVINGRPAVWGDAMLGMVQGSGLLQAINESIEGSGDNRVAICEIQRKGHKPQVRKFSVEDAKRAGLWGRKNRDGSPAVWSQYPERMLQMRARAFALRDVFADVLKGMHIAEEAQDIPVDVEDVTPQRKSEAPKQIEAPKAPPETAEPLATDEQKKLIAQYCEKAKFSNRDFGNEMKRDFGQVWETMTEVVAAQMIERLGIRIQELEGTVA